MRKSLRGAAVAVALVIPLPFLAACGSDDKPTKPTHSVSASALCGAGVLIGEEPDGDRLYDTDNDGFVNCELDPDGEIEWLDDTKSGGDFPKLKMPKASTSAPTTPKASQPVAPSKSAPPAKPTPAQPAPEEKAPKKGAPKQEAPKKEAPKKVDKAPAKKS